MPWTTSSLLLAAAAASALPAANAAVAVPGDHGLLDWFEGSFEELLATARKTEKLVFVDFWADWCGWCKRFDRETLSNRDVADELSGLLCYHLDTESEAGKPLALRYYATNLPLLLFLDADGAVVDRVVGYEPPDVFLRTVRRIKSGDGTLPGLEKHVADDPEDLFALFDLAVKLHAVKARDATSTLSDVEQRIAAGRGFDDQSIDDHWQAAKRFQQVKNLAAYTRHMNRIRELDPDEGSLPLRIEELERIKRAVGASYSATGRIDVGQLSGFLAQEQHEELLFSGWMYKRLMHDYQAEEARKRGNLSKRDALLASKREAEREAWRYCPPEHVAGFGHDLAWGWYLASEDLDDEQRAFAVDVARTACAAVPKSSNHLDTLACCLDAAGQHEEALATIRRAMEMDPDNLKLRRRLAELEGDS